MSIVNEADKNLKFWHELILAKKFEDAANLCEHSINEYKDLKINCSDNQSNLKTLALIFAILFKGLQEFSYLVDFLSIENWHKNNRKVEYYNLGILSTS